MSRKPTGAADPVGRDRKVVTGSHDIDIQWGIARDAAFPPANRMKGWARTTLDYLSAPLSEVSIRMMGADEIAALNLRYRNKAGSTNVLSFPGFGQDEAGRRLLGDLALCTDVISAEAAAQGKSVQAHCAHMVVHGLLHLSGYDHEDAIEAREMERVEVTILERLGFADPYEEPAGQEDDDHE